MQPVAKRRAKPAPSTSTQPTTSFLSRLDLFICIFLFIAVFTVYGQVITHSFVTFDDPVYVTGNPHVRAGITADGVAWAFTSFDDSNWFPLTWLSHMLDVQLFGLDSGWHHLINVLLHALSSLVLFVALRRMTGARWPSAMVAVVFALHPLHVESVAWIAERKDVLSALFWMLTLWAYAAYVARPSRSRYGLTLLPFCLGLTAKPMLVTLPVVLLLLDQWPLHRGLRLKEKLPFFAAAVASSIVTYLSHQAGGAVAAFEVVPLATRVENAFVTYVVYIQQSFWPARLAVFYPYPLHSLLVSAIFAGVALLTVTVLVTLAYLKRPYLAVGWLWYLVTLLPVIGIIQTGSQSRADRYTYIPMIGLSIAVVFALAELLAPRPKFAAALAAAVTTACLALTWIQVQHWHDSIALYQHAIAVVPDNYLARFNLASALDAEGMTNEAIVQLREAVRVRPLYVPARAELGQLLARQGHPDEALQELRTAVGQRPNDPVARFRLGSVLGSLGHADEASAEFAEAVRLQPGNADAHFNYGIALAQQGHLQDALREFTSTVGLRPDDAAAHFNLGITFAKLNQLDPAIAHFSEAVRLKPDFAEARQALDRAIDLQQRPTSR